MDEYTAPITPLGDVGFKTPPVSLKARAFAHAALWLPLLLVLFAVTPRVEALFADFGVPLPLFSRCVLCLGHAMRFAVVVAPLALAGLVALDLGVSRALLGDARRLRAWSLLMTVLPLAVLAAVLAGLVLPFFSLTDRLSG